MKSQKEQPLIKITPLEQTHIVCDANNCKYNTEGNCKLKNIVLSNIGYCNNRRLGGFE